MDRRQKTIKVIAAWMNRHGDGSSFSTMWFSGGEGGVRVFDKDGLDPRATAGQAEVPYFKRGERGAALLWLDTHRGNSCQLDVRLALQMGFARADLATYEQLEGAQL